MKFKKLYKLNLFLMGVITLLCLFFTTNGVVFADDNQEEFKPRVVGYLPNWAYREYENIDFSTLTHINIAFCNVGSNGEFNTGIPDNAMQAIMQKAKDNNVKVIAALGGGGYCDPYRSLIAGTDKITALNNKLTAFCQKYGFDGIDLDIELGSSDAVWDYYGEWVAALRVICDENGWLLSTATAQWVAHDVTLETFALFDYVNVMAYDNDSRSEKSHSSYNFAVECLNYFNVQKGVPKEKLVLGVPFYGRGYNSNGTLDWNSYISFEDIVKADENFYDLDVYNGVAYNGASTMRKKCQLAKDYGGIMIWEITLDALGDFSLLSLIKEEIITPYISTVPENQSNVYNVVSVRIPIIAAGVILLGTIAFAITLPFKRKS